MQRPNMKLQVQVGEFIWKIHNKYQCMSSQFSSWWSFSPSFHIYFFVYSFIHFFVWYRILCGWPVQTMLQSILFLFFVYIVSAEFSWLVRLLWVVGYACLHDINLSSIVIIPLVYSVTPNVYNSWFVCNWL